MSTQQLSYWTQRTLTTTCKRHVLLSCSADVGHPVLKKQTKLIDAKRLRTEMSETIIPLHVISDVITIPDSTGQVRS